jgi:hypothetical protein
MPKLPDDFPHLSTLNAAGINTELQLSKYADDYTKIPGIGPSGAKDIAAAVAASPADEDTTKTQPLAKAAVAPAADEGVAVKFRLDRDTVLNGRAFAINPETQVAAKVVVSGGVFYGVGCKDEAGGYQLVEAAKG